MSAVLRDIRAFLFALVALAGSLAAQTTGVVSGHALDPSGALVPNSVITLTTSAGIIRTTRTDSSGAFTVTGLIPATYSLHAAAAGFSDFTTSIDISPGKVASQDIRFQVAVDRQQIRVTEQEQTTVDPVNNAASVTIRGTDLDSLADNSDDLQTDLQALAGPGSGPNGGQILVDGFSGVQLPPKDSIREIRINANPFSAEFELVAQGRVEIFTKPGTDKLHGSFAYNISDNIWNARNPFSTSKPDNRSQQYSLNFGGSFTKRISFNVDALRYLIDDTNFINALVLDSNYQPTRLIQNTTNPNDRYFLSPRLDIALTPNQTLQMRYTQSRNFGKNNFIGGLQLPSRGSTTVNGFHAFILSHTAVIGTRAVNESKYLQQFTRNTVQGNTFTPTIQVLDAFYGGGANQDINYAETFAQEFQNNTTYTRGRHLWKFGARARGSSLDSAATNNFNGAYTFTSIDSYATTVRGLAQGLSIGQIRALGGGARQYSVTGGDPLASISQWDFATFAQDDWRVRPNFTVSAGLRYEWQTNINDHRAIAPRLGLAWGLGGAGRSTQPRTVLRAGFGIFYDRFDRDLTLRTIRQDGVRQQNFIVLDPLFFPQAPSTSALAANRLPQAVYRKQQDLVAPTQYYSAFTVERQLASNTTLSVNYYFNRAIHEVRSRNINAPLPGGTYPFGTAGQIYLYESSGFYRQSIVSATFNTRFTTNFQMFGTYTWSKVTSDFDNAGSFPANNYDVAQERGRASWDIRHRLQLNGNFNFPLGLRLSPLIGWNSAPPFNIISGVDTNGDSMFTDRPAFATDLSRPGVRRTPWGNFDPNPLPGQTIVPRNLGTGFARFDANVRLSRTWSLGERKTGTNTRRALLTLGAQARNILNYVNRATPSGNLSSPLFGQALGVTGGPSASNRRLEFNARIEF